MRQQKLISQGLMSQDIGYRFSFKKPLKNWSLGQIQRKLF
jgi:hypothetical protein